VRCDTATAMFTSNVYRCIIYMYNIYIYIYIYIIVYAYGTQK
jgi:hypothetical protein